MGQLVGLRPLEERGVRKPNFNSLDFVILFGQSSYAQFAILLSRKTAHDRTFGGEQGDMEKGLSLTIR